MGHNAVFLFFFFFLQLSAICKVLFHNLHERDWTGLDWTGLYQSAEVRGWAGVEVEVEIEG